MFSITLPVNIVHRPLHMLNRCVWKDAMTEVEDVTRSTPGFMQHSIYLDLEFAPRCQQCDRVEIALDRFAWAELLPIPTERHTPIHTDHIAARSYHFVDIGGRACAKVN